MTKTDTRPAPASTAPQGKPAKAKEPKPKESRRDVLDQIIVAFILAILIRGFEAEAFVIPTGSMAPTLKGRHLEITCPQCGHTFTVGADDRNEEYVLKNRPIDTVVCGNCRFQTPTADAPRFKGDRILVTKFPYEFPSLPGSSAPRRWDVIVFHWPEGPETNYIKRMVGLPNEELKIGYGDLYARPRDSNETFQILRKPLDHQQAMQMLVNDDAHRAKLLKGDPAWSRWQGAKGDWSESKAGEFVSPTTASGEWSSLRYRHLIPDPEQWAAIAQAKPLPRRPRPTLITDFYAYNASTISEISHPISAWLQHDWVGDLTVSCRLTSTSEAGLVRLELVEAGVTNRCEIDLSTGLATLFHGETKLGEASTKLKGKASYPVEFANVDDRLTLWVDGETPFGEGLTYDDGPLPNYGPTAADLDPVGIAVKGGMVRVSELVLKRDIYYTQEAGPPDASIPSTFDGGRENGMAPVYSMFDLLADPTRFGPLMTGLSSRTFSIKPDHYMMMGDNSPRSSDSRAWGRIDRSWDTGDRESWEVPRELLIGKAFFVYWPHAVPFWPNIGLDRDLRVPFRPYFERMRPIR